MNETRRKPSTRTRCPTLLDKCQGIFYMPVAQTRMDLPRPLLPQHRHRPTAKTSFLHEKHKTINWIDRKSGPSKILMKWKCTNPGWSAGVLCHPFCMYNLRLASDRPYTSSTSDGTNITFYVNACKISTYVSVYKACSEWKSEQLSL